MNIDLLVTGGTGLLGSALKDLGPNATYVCSRDADLTDIEQVRSLFDRLKPRRVLHLAAQVGGVKANAIRNADLFTENVQINTNVLSTAQHAGVSRLISVLSSCAFQLYSDRASAEEDLHIGMPFKGNLGYSWSKRSLDIQTRLLAEQCGARFSTIAPVTMYGAHDEFDPDEGHVVAALIARCVSAKRHDEPLVVWGNGRAMRQFVYVGDVARFLLEALERDDGPETVIVAPDDGLSVAELAPIVAEVIGFNGPIVFDQDQPEGVLVKRLKSRRTDTWLTDFQFTPLYEGIKNTVAWYLDNVSGCQAGDRVRLKQTKND